MLVSQCSLYRDRTLTKVKTCLIFSHIPLDPWVYFYQKVSYKLKKKRRSNQYALYRLEQDHLTWLTLIYLVWCLKRWCLLWFLLKLQGVSLFSPKNSKTRLVETAEFFCTGETTDVLNYGLGLANEVNFLSFEVI